MNSPLEQMRRIGLRLIAAVTMVEQLGLNFCEYYYGPAEGDKNVTVSHSNTDKEFYKRYERCDI